MTIAASLQRAAQPGTRGIQTTSFDLGANSLIMVQASGRLRAALEKDFSLIDLFRYPTVSALAAQLGQNGRRRSDLAGKATSAAGRESMRLQEASDRLTQSSPVPATVPREELGYKEHSRRISTG